MKGLLAVERMVLESVAKHKSTVTEVSKDTNLSKMFVRTILSNLKDYGVIEYKKGQIQIPDNLSSLKKVNQNVRYELKDLFSSLVDNHYDNKTDCELKMQKIWLTEYEYKVLKSLMNNIEIFIKSVRKDRLHKPEEEVIAEQRVIFWGCDSYQNIVASDLRVA